MTVKKINTHTEDAVARLLHQFEDSETLQKFISVFSDRMQNIENATKNVDVQIGSGDSGTVTVTALENEIGTDATNQAKIEVVVPTSGGPSGLSVSIDSNNKITVQLAIDSSDNLDSAQNTASLVAKEIDKLDGFVASASGDGSGSLDSNEGPKPFTGFTRRHSIDNAETVVLDRIGELLGVPRRGVDDSRYRLLLKTKLIVIKAAGLASDFIKLVQTLERDEQFNIVLHEFDSATLYVELQQPLQQTTITRMLDFMKEIKAAGVRFLLEVYEAEETDTFTFSPTTSVQSDASRGFEDSTNPGTGGLITGVYE